MGHNKNKQLAKRRCARLRHHLEHAAEQTALLYLMFKETHPEHSELLEQLGVAIEALTGIVENFWTDCWGDVPENWESWV